MPRHPTRYAARAAPSALWLVVIVGLGLWVVRHLDPEPNSPTVDQRTTLSLLKSEPLLFLATRRTVAQIVVERHEGSWSGDYQAVSWATVRWTWGVDLSRLADDDIRMVGSGWVVRLPEPELLEFSIEPGSLRSFSKATAIPRLQEYLDHEDRRAALEASLREQAMRFARVNQLTPTRTQLVSQLNDAARVLLAGDGRSLRFE